MLFEVVASISISGSPPPELVDQFTDGLMEALLAKEPEALDADVRATLTTGDVEVVFFIEAQTTAEAHSRGPALLHEAVRAAGVEPQGSWTDVPGHPNHGTLDEQRVCREPHPTATVRRVSSELVDA
jgi:hypothetical protein